MPDGRGGYRAPANPAPVSGPGAHSRRTDGQPIRDLPNAEYGEGEHFREIQQGSPLARAQTPSGAPEAASRPVVGLGEPSLEPDVPVTSGAALGPGPGIEALGMVSPDQMDAEEFRRYVPILLDVAQRDSTPRSTRTLIRRLLASR
jgi:hypothetical protein